MGVPALFRWLSRKYPKIVESVAEDKPVVVDGIVQPLDMTQPNPNGMEFDCLYLDMNGIVHPCSHPEDDEPPKSEEEMMASVFKYTDRIVNLVRPRKLLMIAIDGVAPRAKMNQQRSRRFRAAKEAALKQAKRLEAIADLESQGQRIPDEVKHYTPWDSNAITPGTPFMDLLAASLRYWITFKLNKDPGWQDLQVIISDASVPGEGEHKIMSYIRRQRVQKGYDPNTKHVIYGLDADLIMLALATHEMHFKVLREDVFQQSATQSNACRTCGQEGHYAASCRNPPKIDLVVDKKPNAAPVLMSKPFIFLDISVLREYLALELNVPDLPFALDLERAIDDWILLCFLVGNDFLPHIPSLEIREGAIDLLLTIWKQKLPVMMGYVANQGKIDIDRMKMIMDGLASKEDEIFRKRKAAEDRQERRNARDDSYRRFDDAQQSQQTTQTIITHSHTLGPAALRKAHTAAMASHAAEAVSVTSNVLPGKPAAEPAPGPLIVAAVEDANVKAADALRAKLQQKLQKAKGIPAALETSVQVKTEVADAGPLANLKRKLDEAGEEEVSTDPSDVEEAPPVPDEPAEALPEEDVIDEDEVKLYEDGYSDRYYRSKFQIEPGSAEVVEIVRRYLEGLSWVLAYYYQGCPSWDWYYPYHYAPFAKDFELAKVKSFTFDQGHPFKPFEQLMGVFPRASGIFIPEPFRLLMSDENSPILHFYPLDFKIDLNGKKMAWQGVALLPFIDEKELLKALEPRYQLLTDDDNRRNSKGTDEIFVSQNNRLYSSLAALYGKRRHPKPVPLDLKESHGLSGSVEAKADNDILSSTLTTPLANLEPWNDIEHVDSISAIYHFPAQSRAHESKVLPGAKAPASILGPEDRNHVFNSASIEHNSQNRRGKRQVSGRGFAQSNMQRSGYYVEQNTNAHSDYGYGQEQQQYYQQSYTQPSYNPHLHPNGAYQPQAYSTPYPVISNTLVNPQSAYATGQASHSWTNGPQNSYVNGNGGYSTNYGHNYQSQPNYGYTNAPSAAYSYPGTHSQSTHSQSRSSAPLASSHQAYGSTGYTAQHTPTAYAARSQAANPFPGSGAYRHAEPQRSTPYNPLPQYGRQNTKRL